jgi:23S rRNA (uracil1939-C5)-methyltransferase
MHQTPPSHQSARRTFGEIVSGLLRARPALPPPACRDAAGRTCRVCAASTIAYDDEVVLKRTAFPLYWNTVGVNCAPDPLVPSPQGRHYRTVTHRKVFVQGRAIRLALIDPVNGRPFTPLACAIEPPSHAAIYQELEHSINAPRAAALADELQYAVIRGTGTEVAVILNVRRLKPALVHQANTLSRALTQRCPGIQTVLLYEGGDDDTYYLGGSASERPGKVRKLFGAQTIACRIGALTFRFSPLSFTQVNPAILPVFLRTIGELIEPAGNRDLYDLYCGYGLFALPLAASFRRVTGIEMSGPSVLSAIDNARRLRITNVRFLRSAITEETVAGLLRGLSETGSVIVDPPRGGTAPGVIEEIAAARPASVLHIFCNADIVERELRRWRSAGYAAQRAVPFDMFPGTTDVEIAVLLKGTV